MWGHVRQSRLCTNRPNSLSHTCASRWLAGSTVVGVPARRLPCLGEVELPVRHASSCSRTPRSRWLCKGHVPSSRRPRKSTQLLPQLHDDSIRHLTSQRRHGAHLRTHRMLMSILTKCEDVRSIKPVGDAPLWMLVVDIHTKVTECLKPAFRRSQALFHDSILSGWRRLRTREQGPTTRGQRGRNLSERAVRENHLRLASWWCLMTTPRGWTTPRGCHCARG